MKPFFLISTRPEDVTSVAEYGQFLASGGLEERDLVQWRLESEPLPDDLDLDDWSGVLLGGSPFTGVVPLELQSDTQRRVEAELRGLMDRLVERDFPLLGACYGVGTLGRHQGAVVDTTYPEEINAPTLRVTPDGRADPLLAGVPDTFRAYVGHKEAITVLPAHATLLVEGDVAPVQMFRVKENLYGTQFHPEVDEAGMLQRVEVYRLAGYFDPNEQERTESLVRGADVAASHLVVRNFVERYGR